MEELYVMHELQEDSFQDTETLQEPAHEVNSTLEWLPEEPMEEPEPTGHNLVFVPIDEPCPNWEMELAQAYVRAQPLEGVFSPEEGLRMGTAFPNLSQPYSGR